jgi:rRNA-processing protein FCF1
MRIVLDTNFLVDCIRFKIDIKSELAGNEIFLTDQILFEIEKITERKTKESSLAKLALGYIKRKGLKILKSKGRNADESLIVYSKNGYAIATHDKVLKNKIKRAGGKVIFIRQKRYVVFE